MRVLLTLALLSLMVGTAFGQRRLENFDALASRPKTRALSPAAQSGLNKLTRPGSKVYMEERLGVPTFLWASREAATLTILCSG